MSTVITIDRRKIPDTLRQRFVALVYSKQTDRQWTDVDHGFTEDGREYWVVYLKGRDTPAYTWQRDPDGTYRVIDNSDWKTIGEKLTETSLLNLLQGLP